MERSLERPCLVMAYGDSALAARIARYFRRSGWTVRLTSFGAEAVRLADEVRPQLVAIDLDLREAAGWSTYGRIRAVYPEQKIVLLTHRVAGEIGEAGTVLATREDCFEVFADQINAVAYAGV